MVKIFGGRSSFAEFHFAPQPALFKLPVKKDDKGGIEHLPLDRQDVLAFLKDTNRHGG